MVHASLCFIDTFSSRTRTTFSRERLHGAPEANQPYFCAEDPDAAASAHAAAELPVRGLEWL
jgi:hypothetical protein